MDERKPKHNTEGRLKNVGRTKELWKLIKDRNKMIEILNIIPSISNFPGNVSIDSDNIEGDVMKTIC